MKRKILCTLICFFTASSICLADRFVPEFNEMKTIKCDINETIYNQDNTIVSSSNYFRIFKLDDENKKIYLQKAPVEKILYYESDKIEFNLQHLTDDYIMQTSVTIDRQAGKYISNSVLTYDNEVFGVKHAKATGTCHSVN